MISIDLIGLTATLCIIGVRYPIYGVLAALIHEFGRFAMTIFLNSQMDSIVAAGAFGTLAVTDGDPATNALIAFGGPLANLVIGAASGAGKFGANGTRQLLDPLARLCNPFAVVNLRLMLIACLFHVSQL